MVLESCSEMFLLVVTQISHEIEILSFPSLSERGPLGSGASFFEKGGDRDFSSKMMIRCSSVRLYRIPAPGPSIGPFEYFKLRCANRGLSVQLL